jgi:hypothetical protein
MLVPAGITALASAALFVALVLMADRKRGAALAQAALAVAGVLVFVAILVPGPVAGIAPAALATVAVGLLSASGAGMLYHLYLGRFSRARDARIVFVAVFLGLSALFGLVFLSLI